MSDIEKKEHFHFDDEEHEHEYEEIEIEYDEDDIYEMTDEDGNIVKVALLCCCELDSGEYALMLPIEENGKEYCQEDCDFIVFRMQETEDETLFEAVDDDAELEAAVAEFERLMEEAEEEE